MKTVGKLPWEVGRFIKILWVPVCIVVEAPEKYWLPLVEMEPVTQVQILDEAHCIQYSANIIEKGMNPTVLRRDMVKY